MVNFPFFYRYPHPYYYRNPMAPNYNISNNQMKSETSIRNTNNYPNTKKNSNSDLILEEKEQSRIDTIVKESSRYNSVGPIHFQNPFSMDSDEPILEIFGIKLYLDDIIILGLLFFLYEEGVKDDMLFLSLILLLLT